MPTPTEPIGTKDAASTVLTLFGQVHDQIRDEIEGLDEAALNWKPAPGSNSIATIITHIVGSEAETLRSVAGIVDHRDRDAEFLGPVQTLTEVLDTLDRADRLVTEAGPQINGRSLRARLSLPTLPADQRRSGLTWLVGNYGHAREHVGQIQLTKQFYRLSRSRLTLRGRVTSGIGGLAHWMREHADLYESTTGMALHPGSLNLVLPEPWHAPAGCLRIEPPEYGVGMSLVPCHIGGIAGFILRTDKNDSGEGDHPPTVIEVAAPVRLRDALGLSDGDLVEVVVNQQGRS